MKRKTPMSFIELSKANLIHNIKQFRNLAKKGTKFSVAIKGNAYGHGQNEVAKILESCVDHFQVDDIEELELLRKISSKETLLLGYVQKRDLKKTINLGCTLAVFSLEQILTISAIAKKVNKIQKIHIGVDAYLGREGFLLKELPKVLEEIKKCKHVKLSGIYAHFANIEDSADFKHAHKQIEEYKKALRLAQDFGFQNLQTHMSATSGLLAYEKNAGINPLIRLGMGVYGMWPSRDLELKYRNTELRLKPALSWKTKIAQIKILPKGSTIGYGLTYKTKKETKIALIPQGYSDGIDRGLSNKGEFLIGGSRCKILGRVSMNMCVVDVSHLHSVKPEDEVVIIGKQGKDRITAEEMAKKLDTINYEVATRTNALLPRIVR